MKRGLIATLLFLSFVLPEHARAQHPDTIRFTEALMATCEGNSTRSPVFTSNLLALMYDGALATPEEGRLVCSDTEDNEIRWQKIRTDEEGWFTDMEAVATWLHLAYTAPEERIMLLHTAGNGSTYINGKPRAGDIYNFGTVVHPVKLREGRNDIFLVGSRGRISAELSEPEAPIALTSGDMTLPDLVAGKAGEQWGAVRIINSTETFQRGLIIRCAIGGMQTMADVPALSPLITRKIGFRIPAILTGHDDSTHTALLTLSDRTGTVLDTMTFTLETVRPDEDRRETFISSIDGSVQYYAVSPCVSDTVQNPALILSLHGASVEAINQARAYSPKNWATVIAPTNRRPFGFDWEDWGRLDALEVLETALNREEFNQDRVYLTGHSMGGHGTWQLGATFPDKWAAIAPCAGWYSFWSYGGKEENPEMSPVEEIIERSANPSRTLELSRNYRQAGVYIFHGDADRTVPVEQARFMHEHLAAFHPDLSYYEYPGGAHWFNESVDWPPLFDFFKWHTVSGNRDRNTIEFHTACPGISSQNSWIEILQQEQQMAFTSATLNRDPEQKQITGTTKNVRKLALDIRTFAEADTLTLRLDSLNTITLTSPGSTGTIILEKTAEGWQLGSRPAATEKNPTRYGMLKYGMRDSMLFVYGTAGTKEENSWAYAKARYDAETWWYRGNGSVDILPDTLYNPADAPDRSVVLFGNRSTNSAWETLLSQSPVQVSRGNITAGERSLKGDDLGICFVRPHPYSDRASVVVIAGTGTGGMQVANANRYFISGAGFPDMLIVSSAMIREGISGVKGAGFFGNDWSMENGEFQFR